MRTMAMAIPVVTFFLPSGERLPPRDNLGLDRSCPRPIGRTPLEGYAGASNFRIRDSRQADTGKYLHSFHHRLGLQDEPGSGQE
jgi:hypothetical protein